MRNPRSIALWLIAGTAGVILLAWAFPRAFPLLPRPLSVSREQAVRIALERFRDLGEPVKNAYVVTRLDTNALMERRFQWVAEHRGLASLEDSRLPPPMNWRVAVYAPGAPLYEITYGAEIALSGKVLALMLRLDPEAKGAVLAPEEARKRADAFLTHEGVDLSHYEPPELRSVTLAHRVDITVRYRDRLNPLPPGNAHGVEVKFAGDRLVGFDLWLDDPREKEVIRAVRGVAFLSLSRLIWVFLLAGGLALPFLKRYHEGEIGARRGAEIFLLVAGAGLLYMLMCGRALSETSSVGAASREQNTWVIWLSGMVLFFVPAAVLAFFSWSVGESICRERWGHKLAAFDAFFQRAWLNGTVALSAFRGWMAGLAIAGGTAALLLAVRAGGGWPLASQVMSGNSPWPGLDLFLLILVFELSFTLAVVLCLLPLAARRLGRWWGSLLAVAVFGVIHPSIATVLPVGWTLLTSALFGAALVALFLTTDLLTVLLAAFVAQTLIATYPLLTSVAPALQLQGWLALGLLAVPLLVSLRYLGSQKEFVYRYEDIPPHVRRIADRERQRVELETARRIQSSILPDLPPRLAGVDIAHAYLPASEVGGDFYDVLALEDGRLAVAVGDVAGHGVSSGLIMSMAKSALAVQVTFDPEVAAVFQTLNRTVFQTARKRLLTTLVYAVIDPRRLEMVYASAGHLHPYRISATGRVDTMESIAYPLGVRGQLLIDAHTARLSPGDTLFLFSDGVVEARREGDDDMFGFERLQESLARHAGRGAEGLRDGVLADVARFTANAPREDDQTILVLRLP
ncbi:MAG TPA: PP2C family protein-serine/threonine phosphatase [Thermoanaerobaculia bacterium]|nr:PP2C family protein-serine/threonine phosphatase [Thermoanaerobaculia bacterium]